MDAQDVALELRETVERACSRLIGLDTQFTILRLLVQHAMDHGWKPTAEEIVALAVGELSDHDAAAARNPYLGPISAMLELMMDITGPKEASHG